MITYFARPTYLYNTDTERNLLKLLETDSVIKFDNIPLPPALLKGLKREKWLCQNYFFPLIDKCDRFVYTFGFDNEAKKGSNEVGVKGELNYALYKKKPIYRIDIDGIDGTDSRIIEMNNETFHRIYDNNKIFRKKWVLKSIEDYRMFYKNNIEAVELIYSQFREFRDRSGYGGSKQPIIPHRNTLWATNEFRSKFALKRCSIHGTNHAFIDSRKQQVENYCPYYGVGNLKPAYGKRKLDYIDEYDSRELILSSRVIHKLCWIIDNTGFEKLGFCVKDENGNLILQKDGDVIADVNKIVGIEPLFDIDIKSEVKDTGKNFFDKDIFAEYLEAIKICENYVENEMCGMEYKRGFSGNGIYFIFDPILFLNVPDEDGKTYYDTNSESFLKTWLEWIEDIQKKFDDRGLKSLRLENLYGWNRYFKVMGTLHANKERIAIPLNKDEVLDFGWMNEMTKIEKGLEGNIFQEILRKAGNTWKI